MNKFYTNILRKGNKLLVRAVEDGVRKSYKVPFKPSLFIKTTNEDEIVSYDMNGVGLAEINFDSMSDMMDWKRQYKDMEDFKIYGDVDPMWQYINKEFPTDIEFDSKHIVISNIDIEVHSPNEFPYADKAVHPISAITVKKQGVFYTFALDNEQFGGEGGHWQNKENREDIIYKHFMEESDLLEAFILFWSQDYCDVVTGWNIEHFDIPYIINRTEQLLGEFWVKRLSPWGLVKSRTSKDSWGGETTTWIMEGIAELDYLDLYKSYTYSKSESYKLDYVASIELGEKKLSYDEMTGLPELYVKNFQKYIDYNIQDVNLVERINDKMQLFELVFTITYLAKINYVDTSGPVRTWDALIYYFLNKDNIQVPPFVRTSKEESIPGGYVMDPVIGRHKWVMAFDLASLYPSLIRQYNIGTETHVPRYELPDEILDLIPQITEQKLLNKEVDLSILEEYDLSMTANVEFWKRDKKSFFSSLMESLYYKRKAWKKTMLEWQSEKELIIEEMKKRGLPT